MKPSLREHFGNNEEIFLLPEDFRKRGIIKGTLIHEYRRENRDKKRKDDGPRRLAEEVAGKLAEEAVYLIKQIDGKPDYDLHQNPDYGLDIPELKSDVVDGGIVKACTYSWYDKWEDRPDNNRRTGASFLIAPDEVISTGEIEINGEFVPKPLQHTDNVAVIFALVYDGITERDENGRDYFWGEPTGECIIYGWLLMGKLRELWKPSFVYRPHNRDITWKRAIYFDDLRQYLKPISEL